MAAYVVTPVYVLSLTVEVFTDTRCIREKDGMVEEAQRIILNIKQMEASLEGTKPDDCDDRDLSVSYPLTRCLQSLKQKHSTIAKMHKERFEQVKSMSRERIKPRCHA